MTQAEVGAYVQTHLRNNGINVVLSGGASAGVYSAGEYTSKDLDMVREYGAGRRAIGDALREIGFEEQPGKYFKHTDSKQLLEFLGGPAMVGSEQVKQIDTIEYPTGELRIISPTDCVKDRLAAYFYFDDRPGLEQAVMVAKANEVDLDEVERWSGSEEALDKFEEFKAELAGAG